MLRRGRYHVKRYERPVVVATYDAVELRTEAALVAVASGKMPSGD